MSNQEAFIGVIELSGPWPPRRPTVLREGVAKQSSHTVIVYPDGSVEIKAADLNGNELCSKRFQRIAVPNNAVLLFDMEWRTGDARLSINTIELMPADDSLEIIALTSIRTHIPSEAKSYEHAEANQMCQFWVDWRASRFQSPISRGSDRTRKTPDAQANDLRTAISTLELHLSAKDAFGNPLIGSIAGDLRGLIYWKSDSPKEMYNPLLLRVANMAKLPLPVYAVDDALVPNIGTDNHRFHRGNIPSITQIKARQHVMDIQQWLVTTEITEYDSSFPDGVRRCDQRFLISEDANTLGPTHYDEETSDFTDLMATHKSNTSDGRAFYFLEVGRVVVALSRWVISELEKRGVVRPQANR